MGAQRIFHMNDLNERHLKMILTILNVIIMAQCCLEKPMVKPWNPEVDNLVYDLSQLPAHNSHQTFGY